MRTLINPGDTIAGDVIWYFFEKPAKVLRSFKGRQFGRFLGRGEARVDVPLKVLKLGEKPGESEKIVCRSADWECDRGPRRQRKTTRGNHTGFEGLIRGNAVATIRVPMK